RRRCANRSSEIVNSNTLPTHPPLQGARPATTVSSSWSESTWATSQSCTRRATGTRQTLMTSLPKASTPSSSTDFRRVWSILFSILTKSSRLGCSGGP
ncbi:hypothetical protein HK405_000967, partial [Cladochytrium tenue]